MLSLVYSIEADGASHASVLLGVGGGIHPLVFNDHILGHGASSRVRLAERRGGDVGHYGSATVRATW
jgi:hypothetical protein